MYRHMIDVDSHQLPRIDSVSEKKLCTQNSQKENKCPMEVTTENITKCPLAVTKANSIGDVMSQRIAEEANRLSNKQRSILQATFIPVSKNAVSNGLKIFVKLFSEYPRYKLIWPQFRAIPDSSLMNAIELRRHASIYICGLGRIINSMGNEEELAKEMTLIARAHIKWNVQRSHVINMIDPVLDVVKESNHYTLDEDTKTAWSILYQVIAELIEIFRDHELNKLNSV